MHFSLGATGTSVDVTRYVYTTRYCQKDAWRYPDRKAPETPGNIESMSIFGRIKYWRMERLDFYLNRDDISALAAKLVEARLPDLTEPGTVLTLIQTTLAGEHREPMLSGLAGNLSPEALVTLLAAALNGGNQRHILAGLGAALDDGTKFALFSALLAPTPPAEPEEPEEPEEADC